MGQKVHPNGFRLGITKNWSSSWYKDFRDYHLYLKEDYNIRKFLDKELSKASVSDLQIERMVNKLCLTIFTAKPGVIIGKKGGGVELIKSSLQKMTNNEVVINIVENRRPEINAVLVASNVASQLSKRVSFRKALKRAIQGAMRMGAQGIKISCSGRLGGAEIARTEWYKEGRIPLHTIKANIDYGFSEAKTTYGILGIKVWIYTGDATGNFLSNINN